MPRDQVILFDLGGVLIENTGRDALHALLPYELERSQIFERWLESPVVQQFERGLISTEAFAVQLVEEWRLEIAPAQFIAAFATWPKGLYDGAEALVRELRMQHRVACLSNTNPVHWARFPRLPGIFDVSFASHLTGFVKPDRAAFDHAIDQLGVPANSVHFFDDLLPNIEAAQAVGINAYHVGGFDEIAPALRAAGLYR